MIKVSVLTPVFNEKRYIKEAVESVLSQDGNFEIEMIVVDDFSTDGTFEYVEQNFANDNRVKCIRNSVKGKNNAFNCAYDNSTGDYFILLGGDDVLTKNSVQQRLDPVLKFGGDQPAVSFCKLKMISQIARFNGVVTPKGTSKGSVSGGCILYNKHFAEMCFPLPTSLPNEDGWIVNHTKYFKNVHVYHVSKIGLLYRIHEGNSLSQMVPFSEKTNKLNRRFIVHSIFLEKYRGKLTDSAKKELSVLSTLEMLRFSGSWLSILFFKNITLYQKARFIFHSNSLFYWFRNRFFRLFSGLS